MHTYWKIAAPAPAIALLFASTLVAQTSTAPNLRILLPERPRLLQGQLVDLVIEVRNATAVSGLIVTAGTNNITSKFSRSVAAQLDCDTSSDWVIRANLKSFDTLGAIHLTAAASADGTQVTDSRDILIRPFSLPADGTRRNVILFHR